MILLWEFWVITREELLNRSSPASKMMSWAWGTIDRVNIFIEGVVLLGLKWELGSEGGLGILLGAGGSCGGIGWGEARGKRMEGEMKGLLGKGWMGPG